MTETPTPDFMPLEAIAELPRDRVRDLKRVLNRACHLDAEGAMALESEAALRGFLDPATAGRIAAFSKR